MFKRLVCAFMSALLLMGALSFAPLSVYAEDGTEATTAQAELTAQTEETTQPKDDLPVNETRMSAQGIALLKQFEGFRVKPYWDVSQWSVGYGTRCPEDKRALWTEVGITEREAEGLLFTYVNKFGAALDSFIKKYKLNLNQHQYDALMLFTYNVGSGWMNQSGLMRSAVINGAKGNDFIYPFVLWCKADRVFSNGLIERRLAEANLYLNGVYGRRPPSDYSFVRFDLNGGESDYAVQGYDVDSPVEIKIIPEKTYTASNGAVYEFAGWYTSRNGGTKVEKLDSSIGYGVYLYAHWTKIKEGNGQPDDSGTATWVDVEVTAKSLNYRNGPGTSYDAKGSYPKGTQLTIVETKKVGTDLWGKVANTGTQGYWVSLSYTTYDSVIANQKPTTAPTTKPTTAPTTKPTTAPTTKPTTAPTTKPTTAPTTKPTTAPTTQPQTKPQGTKGNWKGVIKTAGSQLRVRSEASTDAKVVSFLDNGTPVTITERITLGGLEWGRMEKGWISLKYVDFTTTETVPPTTQTQPKPTEPAPTTPTEPETTLPETEATEHSVPDGPGYWIGTVNASAVQIRRAAGNYYDIVGYYRNGDSVELTECRTVDGQLWGRVDEGWICLSGVSLDGETTEPEIGYRTVNVCSLRVRSDAGLGNAIVAFLNFGDRVAILEQRDAGGTPWGLTDFGWVNLKYLL